MCGVSGIVKLPVTSSQVVERTDLENMAHALVHRGPDESGLFIDGPVGFAHTRLSIIDLAGGRQPMQTDDRSITIIFNGEVFNHVELRRDLEREGMAFRTRSDTEVVLQAYRRWGKSAVERLNGQFAIAIWDAKNKELHLVRDRVGICPLFYVIEKGQLVFASEVKAILQGLGRRFKISDRGLTQTFQFWAPIIPETIFEGVRQVPPGRILTVSPEGISESEYWDWPVREGQLHQRNEEACAEELMELLVDATKIRLRSDVPVGAYLSGGLDSSAIVNLILRDTRTQLRTFSLAFEESAFDESKYQKELVTHAKVQHSEICIRPSDIGTNFGRTVWHAETPILRTAPVPMGMLSAHVRDQGFKVVLTGEGADEVLGGYDIFKEAKVRQFWSHEPNSKFRGLLLKRLYPYLTLPKEGDAKYLKSFFGVGLSDPNSAGFSHLPRWQGSTKARSFLLHDNDMPSDEESIESYLGSLPTRVKEADLFSRAQYIESKTMMSSYLLSSQGDRMLMMNSVEGRFPFLDHRVIEFGCQLPTRLKMRVLNEKYLLKKIMKRYLPENIVGRNKQPYRAPNILDGAVAQWPDEIRHALSIEEIRRIGIFNPVKVGLLMKKVTAKKELSNADSQIVTGILSTQIISRQYC